MHTVLGQASSRRIFVAGLVYILFILSFFDVVLTLFISACLYRCGAHTPKPGFIARAPARPRGAAPARVYSRGASSDACKLAILFKRTAGREHITYITHTYIYTNTRVSVHAYTSHTVLTGHSSAGLDDSTPDAVISTGLETWLGIGIGSGLGLGLRLGLG